MQRAVQTCIAYQRCALAILHQCLQEQRNLALEQPSLGQGGSTRERVLSSTPRSGRRTILQVARESRLTRMIGLTSELLSLEQNSLSQLQEPHFHVDYKLNSELRNLCHRMATRGDCLQLDADLKAIEQCLRDIVHQLVTSLPSDSSGSHSQTAAVLKTLFTRFLEI
ncbi:leukemia-associated protein 7 [Mustelus asterias]